MSPGEFATAAERLFAEIPPPFREGVEGVEVDEETVEHEELPGVYTLGQCLTQHWPSAYGGEGETLSRVLLHRGSFAALAAREPGFDWGAELRETLLHELLHHREAAAGEDSLARLDDAEEQDRRRLAGRSFDPDFLAELPVGPDGLIRVDSQLFLPVETEAGAERIAFRWRGRDYEVEVPGDGARLFVTIENLAGGRLCLVVTRTGPLRDRLLGAGPRGVRQLQRSARPVAAPEPSEAASP